VGIAAVTSLAPEARIGAGAGGFVMIATGVLTGQRFFPTDPGFPSFGGGRRAAADKERSSPVPGLISGLPIERRGMTGLRRARESELT
jgi:hypothetical protein